MFSVAGPLRSQVMSTTVKCLLALATLITGAFLVWFWFENFERSTIVTDTDLRGIARRNPYLAAERFLRRTGIPTTDVDVLTELPEQDEVLVILSPRVSFGNLRTQRVLEWALTGGHLIIIPRHNGIRVEEGQFTETVYDQEDSSDDPFLTAINVEAEWIGVLESEDRKSTEFRFDDVREQTTHLARMNEAYQLTTYSDENPESYTDAFGRTRMLELPYGDGAITVLSGARFFNNDHIGEEDNAALLWHVVNAIQAPKSVWIVRRDEFPGLLAVLKQHASEALISGFVLLGLWLLSIMRRFGPMLPTPDANRRSLREHLDAAGRFLWHHKHLGPLIAPLRSEVQRRLELRLPSTARLGAEEQIIALAERCSIPSARVKQALTGTLSKDARGFTQAVTDLVTLRDSL